MQPNVRYMAVIESSLISSGLEGVQDICKGTPTVCKEEVPVMLQKLNLCIELNWENIAVLHIGLQPRSLPKKVDQMKTLNTT